MIDYSYEVGETHGSEAESIRATAELWRENVTAFIGRLGNRIVRFSG